MGVVEDSLTTLNDAYWIIAPFVLAFIDAWTATFKMTSHLNGAVLELPAAVTTLQKLGDGFKNIGSAWKSLINIPDLFVQLKSLGGVKGVALGGAAIAAFAVGVAAIGLSLAAAALGEDALTIISSTVSAVVMAVYLMQTIKGVLDAIEMLKDVSKYKTSIQNCKSSSGIANAIGYAIGIGIAWAMFAWQAATLDPSRQQMGAMVATAIATSIVQILMFVISQIPVVGAILEGLILLLDQLVSALCQIFGWDEANNGDNDPYNDVSTWLCGGLEGIVQTLLAWLIFADNDMVDLANANRLSFYELNTNKLLHPDDGMIPGNQLEVSVALTNTIMMNPRAENVGRAYWEYWSDETLHGSTFSYAMETEEQDIHGSLGLYGNAGEWKRVDGTPPEDMWGAHHVHKAEPLYITRSVPAIEAELPAAGINRPLTAGVAEGYAVPVDNCYVGFCLIETESGTFHFSLSDSLIFDIFPATLDGFYDLDYMAFGAYALAWGQGGSASAHPTAGAGTTRARWGSSRTTPGITWCSPSAMAS